MNTCVERPEVKIRKCLRILFRLKFSEKTVFLIHHKRGIGFAQQYPNEILNFGSLWNWQSRHRVERIWAKCWHHLSSRASQSILLMVSSNQFWLSWLRISDQWFTMAHEQYTGAYINFIWLGVVNKQRHSKISECLRLTH